MGRSKRRILLLAENREAAIEHGKRQHAPEAVCSMRGCIRLMRRGRNVRYRNVRCGRFSLGMVNWTHPFELRQCSQGRLLPRRRTCVQIDKTISHDLLDCGLVREVAHRNHHHFLRSIPRVPEIEEAFAPRLCDNFRQPDSKATREQRSSKHCLELRDKIAVAGGIARSFLRQNNASLLVDLLVAQKQSAGVVAENPHSLYHGSVIRMCQLQLVDRAIEAGVGVDISSESHPHPLKELHERAWRVMRAAVERHVLEKMRETSLVVLLVQ